MKPSISFSNLSVSKHRKPFHKVLLLIVFCINTIPPRTSTPLSDKRKDYDFCPRFSLHVCLFFYLVSVGWDPAVTVWSSVPVPHLNKCSLLYFLTSFFNYK